MKSDEELTRELAEAQAKTPPGPPNYLGDAEAAEMREIAEKLKPMIDYIQANVAPLIARYEQLAIKKGPLLERHNVNHIMGRLKHDLDFLADVAATGK